jgi:hypothetical protein
MPQTFHLLLELTEAQATALLHAIDLYFQARIASPASDVVEQMHSKVSDALLSAGFFPNDDDPPAS